MVRRFERMFDAVEPIEQYRSGGYHPVHLDDVFNNRYKVIGKLGHGRHSTVWLAVDQHSQRQIALKIMQADCSKRNRELEVLHYLSESKLSHPGKQYVIDLLDNFEHQGPNGTHPCLVLPVMLSDCNELTVRGLQRNATYIKKFSRDITHGVDFLHACGLIHTDLQPGNILLSIAGSSDSEVSLEPAEFSLVKWIDKSEMDDSAPKYLIPSQRARGALDEAHESSLAIKIGDFGGVIWRNEAFDGEPVTPKSLRPPEIIHGERWNASMDIWCLGCLLFQLATNEPLFLLNTFGLSAECLTRQHQSRIRELFDTHDQGYESFSSYLEKRLSSGFIEDDIQQFSGFLRSMLQTDPSWRISSMQLVRHPWLQEKYEERQRISINGRPMSGGGISNASNGLNAHLSMRLA